MRTTIQALAISLTVAWCGSASAEKIYDPFVETPPQNISPGDAIKKLFLDPEANEKYQNDPQAQACRNSKTYIATFDNCEQPLIRAVYDSYPSDLVELLVAKLRLLAKKQSIGKISKEEVDVQRAEAFVQFENEAARRASLARQDERAREDRELQLQMLERDARRREREMELRKLEAQQERFQRELDEQRRRREAYRAPPMPQQTDCMTNPLTGSISCTTY